MRAWSSDHTTNAEPAQPTTSHTPTRAGYVLTRTVTDEIDMAPPLRLTDSHRFTT
ncbi:hypothetical protein GCM10010201_27190 [Pilimelia columellifera subsp. columellifera]|uniref:Uncharacterized protein n=1 Tax=Pilimelia columellifera subsp. columellifera TaxID=706583 RepID=A0ABN3NM51_9ACTN